MDVKVFLTVFVSILIAELGDKSQLAILLFAADKNVSQLAVFLAACTALIAATLLWVWLGGLLSGLVSEQILRIAAGIGFIAIGLATLFNTSG